MIKGVCDDINAHREFRNSHAGRRLDQIESWRTGVMSGHAGLATKLLEQHKAEVEEVKSARVIR